MTKFTLVIISLIFILFAAIEFIPTREWWGAATLAVVFFLAGMVYSAAFKALLEQIL